MLTYASIARIAPYPFSYIRMALCCVTGNLPQVHVRLKLGAASMPILVLGTMSAGTQNRGGQEVGKPTSASTSSKRQDVVAVKFSPAAEEALAPMASR